MILFILGFSIYYVFVFVWWVRGILGLRFLGLVGILIVLGSIGILVCSGYGGAC